jgi:arylsulfatase
MADQDQLTTKYTERAIKYIEDNKDGPFFLYLAHAMVHVPIGVSDKFRGKSTMGLFGDVMMEVDWSVGEVLKTLEMNGLTDNTLVIFTSDNGPWLCYGNHSGSTGGLREAKWTAFEGGQRVPCIMKWPGVIEEGAICNKLTSSIDLFATFADITGAKMPAHKTDGVSLLPLLKGEKDANPREEFYYYYGGGLRAVQKDGWKLIFPQVSRSYEGYLTKNDGWEGGYGDITIEKMELYDLRLDQGERYDLSELNPDVVEELVTIGDKAREELGDAITKVKGKNVRPIGILPEELQNDLNKPVGELHK